MAVGANLTSSGERLVVILLSTARDDRNEAVGVISPNGAPPVLVCSRSVFSLALHSRHDDDMELSD